MCIRDSARIIPLVSDEALPDQLRFWNGASRGRFEGDTLIVETAHYNADGVTRGASQDLRVVERFERVGPDRIEWTITYADESTWDQPWTMMIPLERTDDKIYEYACHEGNHSMQGIMAGARVEEQEAHSADDR